MDKDGPVWIYITDDEEEEYIPESEEEEDEAEDIMEYEEDEDAAEQLEEMRAPVVTSWMGPDGITVHGVMCIDDGIIRLMNRCRLDDCSICLKPSTAHGNHQICGLPCGHMYGFSCIKKWLLLSASGGKCPKCNTSCSSKDAKLLYPPRLCNTAHQKALLAAFFPFTKQGFLEFKKYEYSRMLDAQLLQAADIAHMNILMTKHNDLAYRVKELARKWGNLLTRAEKLEERAKSLRLADALRRRASLLGPRVEALQRRTDARERLVSALRRRMDALEQRSDAFESRMRFYFQMYEEHHKREEEIAKAKQDLQWKKKLAEKAAAKEKEAEKAAEKKLKDKEKKDEKKMQASGSVEVPEVEDDAHEPEEVVYVSEGEGEDDDDEDYDVDDDDVDDGEEVDDDEEEEEEDNDDDDDDDDDDAVEGRGGENIMESEEEDEEEAEELEEMRPPLVTNWMGPDGITVHGIMCIDDGLIRSKNRCKLDDCSICWKPSTTHGKHQLCCLPCEHIYGLSCIKKWLPQSPSSGKCPQCNIFCSFQDVALLYPPRLCDTAHQKASSAVTFFPFTKQGYLEFEKYESSRMRVAQLLRDDDIAHENILVTEYNELEDRRKELARRWDNLLTRAEEPEKHVGDANVLRRRASLLKPQIDALGRRTDTLARLVNALRRRMDALKQRSDAFDSRMAFYSQMYKEHQKREEEIEKAKQDLQRKKNLTETAGSKRRERSWESSREEAGIWHC